MESEESRQQRLSIVKPRFEKAKRRLQENNASVRRIVKINNSLKTYNAAFIHPYLLGYQINQLEQLIASDTIDEQKIFELFARSFHELNMTAYYIDGYFKERPSLKPFIPLIDQSVILYLQQDFGGAINLLLPVVEGAIRQYLIANKNKTHGQLTSTKQLLVVFDELADDYVQTCNQWLRNPSDIFEARYPYDDNQIIMLLKYHREYITCWLSMLKDYLLNNLYLDSRTGISPDQLNRHTIFHAFSGDTIYSHENYLKIFNCIIFLNWVLGIVDPNISILPTLDEKEIAYKWKVFEKVRYVARYSWAIKKSLKYDTPDQLPRIDDFLFKDQAYHVFVKLKMRSIPEGLDKIDQLIDAHFAPKKPAEAKKSIAEKFLERLVKKN